MFYAELDVFFVFFGYPFIFKVSIRNIYAFSFPKNASLQNLCLYAATGGALYTEGQLTIINIDELFWLYPAQVPFVIKWYCFWAMSSGLIGQPYHCSLL
ncbi:hypothetical protein ES703_77700 [subsurface metagenome]